jgi:lysophospholipase L1-like esterase
MNNRMKKIIFLLCLISSPLWAQHAFENEIRNYEKQDSISMPAKGQILFIGSSSFRIWKTFAADLAGIPAINRGFGGSTMTDALYYFDRMVVKYAPKVVVVYEGDNDLNKGISPADLAKQYEEFSSRLKKALPKTKLVYLAVRPSLSRIAIVEKQKQFNAWLENYCKSQKERYFLDMHSPFYLPDGTVMPDIFVADRLHLNEKGYQIFSAKIREFIFEKKLR